MGVERGVGFPSPWAFTERSRTEVRGTFTQGSAASERDIGGVSLWGVLVRGRL